MIKTIIYQLFTILLVFAFKGTNAQNYLAAAKKDGKWGFINDKGVFVIEPKYDKVQPFSEGLAAVNLGYVSTKDAATSQPGKWGFINAKGDWVIQPKFEIAESFNEGLSKINVGALYRNYQGVSLMGGKWGFIDKTGAYIINPSDTLYTSFSEGLCAFKVPRGSAWGYIGKSGNTVLSPTYWEAGLMKNGRAPVMRSDFKFMYIDDKGKQAINTLFQKAAPFQENMAFVKEADGTAEFISPTGEYQFKIEFLKKEENLKLYFKEGLVRAPVEKNNEVVYGFAEKNGKWRIIPQYELADDYHEGLALVFFDRFYKFIDQSGKTIITIQDKYVENPETKIIFKGIPNPNIGNFSHKLCKIKEGKLWGYINDSGTVQIVPAFEDVKDFTLAD